MTLDNRRKIKRILTLSGAIVSFLFFIVFITILTRQYSDETIRVATVTVLETWSGEQATLKNNNSTNRAGLSYSRSYSATIGRRNALVYIVTITGRAGPYSAVFCVPENDTASFCGFLLASENEHSPLQLGITSRTLEHWKKKITTLSSQDRRNP